MGRHAPHRRGFSRTLIGASVNSFPIRTYFSGVFGGDVGEAYERAYCSADLSNTRAPSEVPLTSESRISLRENTVQQCRWLALN